MRVLITWGSKRGGTEGIARMLGDGLRAEGVDVTLAAARAAPRLDGFDAVVVGGAIYANRWHADARRFVGRHTRALGRVPVWLFSSGPLDDSAANEHAIEPVREVDALVERIGAQEHVTFGGRLAPDARGFPASAMARQHAGDWRRPERVRAWATQIARALPTAKPRAVVAQPGHAIARVLVHGVGGWALCAAVMVALLRVAGTTTAIVIHDIFVALAFAAVAAHYFRARGAREPIAVAGAFVALVGLLDVAIAALALRNFAMLTSITGFWLPLALVFFVSWTIGAITAMVPTAKNFPTAAKRTS